ncbi:hypothetical protein [Paenibacillus glucanolyticus]|uniref:hypothetical protein n=1 Tax=Paenibacillus glucanolyticus TaxID=59843 RepID=UPI00096CB017|nr:hypothetical protein [Paenibacillus glucanolyticus]OMF76652.1 hypothetical protein BK142_14090 [Paenibacillus glucanolyticus]
MTSENIQTIGEKVGARYRTFFDKNLERLHATWIAYIQVDGEMLPIYDQNTISGQVEAPNRIEALKIARNTRNDLKARLCKNTLNLQRT